VSKRTTQLDFSGLVERLVPKVAELFATLAAQDPLKMSFADVAGKTILDMVEVMSRDGISQEAIAAGLGMTVGGFRNKLRRLREAYRDPDQIGSGNSRPKTLLEQVYGFIDENYATAGNPVLYIKVADRFKRVPDETLRALLRFLVQYGLLEVEGRGRRRRYRSITLRRSEDVGLPELSVMLFREGPLTLTEIVTRMGRSEEEVLELIAELRDESTLTEEDDETGETVFRVHDYHLPVGLNAGYELAIWDHITAVLTAICKKVRVGQHEAQMQDRIGGTTFSFDVPIGHPIEDEIASFLGESRAKMERWLEQVREIEVTETDEETPRRRVTIYTGQMLEDL
jgi:hypothetical protein